MIDHESLAIGAADRIVAVPKTDGASGPSVRGAR